eukprot:182481-Chlamydomonas_euryale.AAC.1
MHPLIPPPHASVRSACATARSAAAAAWEQRSLPLAKLRRVHPTHPSPSIPPHGCQHCPAFHCVRRDGSLPLAKLPPMHLTRPLSSPALPTAHNSDRPRAHREALVALKQLQERVRLIDESAEEVVKDYQSKIADAHVAKALAASKLISECGAGVCGGSSEVWGGALEQRCGR